MYSDEKFQSLNSIFSLDCTPLCPICKKHIILIDSIIKSDQILLQCVCNSPYNKILDYNFFPLKEYLDFLKSQDFIPCSRHKDKAGLFHCPQCKVNMCLTCSSYHQKFQNGHKIRNNITFQDKCPFHNSVCTFYCKTCDQTFCNICQEEQSHISHSFISLEHLHAAIKKKIKGMNLTKIHSFISAKEEEFNSNVKDYLQQIDNLVNVLTEMKETFLSNCEKIRNYNKDLISLYMICLGNFLKTKECPMINILKNIDRVTLNFKEIKNEYNNLKDYNALLDAVNNYGTNLMKSLDNMYFVSIDKEEKVEDFFKENEKKDRTESTSPISPGNNGSRGMQKDNASVLSFCSGDKNNFMNRKINMEDAEFPVDFLPEKKLRISYNADDLDSFQKNSNTTKNRNNSSILENSICNRPVSSSNKENNNTILPFKVTKKRLADTKPREPSPEPKKMGIFSTVQKRMQLEFSPIFVNIISSPSNENFLAISSEDKILFIYDLKNFEVIREIKTRPYLVLNISSRTVGKTKYYLIAFNDNSIKLLNCETFMIGEREFIGHTKPITQLIPLTKRNFFLSSSKDKTIKVWKERSEKSFITFTGHTGEVTSLVALSDECFISSSSDTTIRIWWINKKESQYVLRGHKRDVLSLSIAPEGMILSCSLDNTIKVWKMIEMVCVHTFTQCGEVPKSAFFLNDNIIVRNKKGIAIINTKTDEATFRETTIGEVENIFLYNNDKFLLGYNKGALVVIE